MSRSETRMRREVSRRQVAVALGYRPARDEAPRVVARGEGEIAERILELAAAHGVPVKRDGDLAGILSAFEPGEEIPEELYRAIAEVLAFIYRLSRESRAGVDPSPPSDRAAAAPPKPPPE